MQRSICPIQWCGLRKKRWGSQIPQNDGNEQQCDTSVFKLVLKLIWTLDCSKIIMWKLCISQSRISSWSATAQSFHDYCFASRFLIWRVQQKWREELISSTDSAHILVFCIFVSENIYLAGQEEADAMECGEQRIYSKTQFVCPLNSSLYVISY